MSKPANSPTLVESLNLCHTAYWIRDPNSGRSLIDWDIYFIETNPGCTKEEAHRSLSLELGILLKNIPRRSNLFAKATTLKNALENSNNDPVNTLLWGNHGKISTLAVMDRINKREIRSVAIQEETERYKSEQEYISHRLEGRTREDLEITSNDYASEPNIKPIQEEPSPGTDYYESINKNDTQNDGFQTLPHQIVSNTYNPEISIDENILRMSAMSLAKLDESKYFGEFIPHFIKYKESQQNNPFSYTIDDVMDIRGEGGFSKFLSVDDYIKLLSKKPKRNVELPEGWRDIIEEYFKETTESGSIKNISDWIRITEELGVVKEEDKELIKIKKYLNRVMLPLIESFSKPVPDISAPNSSEHHYWSEFGHRFFSRALQEFVGLDWRAMEVPVQASKYRKNYGYNHILDRVVDGKSADLLAWMWKTGEEIFVGEQAGPPTQCDLTKLATDSFKLYREMRDCLNVRILRAMGKGDMNYNNRSVFGILGYLFEIKMLIMWKDGVYVYEEYGSLNIASNPNMISEMKSGILRLLEFMMIIKEETKNNVTTEYDADSAQILKRKYNEIIQTKPSPSKVTKR
ncbi:3246_t:CDS:10 [Dentiscutata erythropus]|uniref:3246_t:CDS:1 n=1 Tax=Dentiscutata erythropus TaxID=1348616 RepID=A0A9N9NJ70_9GLOM|nr:3246_t:CDS:10 [Dentiscutata erythropus]